MRLLRCYTLRIFLQIYFVLLQNSQSTYWLAERKFSVLPYYLYLLYDTDTLSPPLLPP